MGPYQNYVPVSNYPGCQIPIPYVHLKPYAYKLDYERKAVFNYISIINKGWFDASFSFAKIWNRFKRTQTNT